MGLAKQLHGYKAIHRDRDPDLRLNRVCRISVERFDAQILFDPLEKNFHCPASLVQLCNCQRREAKIVRQED